MKMRFAERFAITVWCVIAIGVTASFCGAVVAGLYEGPFKDMWWMMPLMERVVAGQASFYDLVSVHGGAHRLAIPRVLFLVDYIFFAGSNRFLVLVSLVAQWIAFLLWFMQVRALPLQRAHKLFLWGFALVVCFSGLQLENVLYTFDTQWFLANTFALLALFYLVGHLTQPGSWRNGVIAVFFGVCASFCSFLGVCALLLVAFATLVVRLQDYRAWMQSFFVVAFVVWYISGFESNAYAAFDVLPSSAPAGSVAVFVLRLIQWTLIYIGSPLTRDAQWLGMLLALCAIIYVGTQSLRFLRNPVQSFTSPALFFLFAALFALAVAVATGLGRMYFMNTADEDRYQTINMTFWLGTWLLALTSCRGKRSRSILTTMVIVWTGYAGVCWHSRDTLARLGEFELVQASAVAQAVGITDYPAIRDTLILGDKTRQINRGLMHADFLTAQQWGAYATDIAKHYGQPVTLTGKGRSCQVILTQAQRLAPGHWKLRLKTDNPVAERIWLVDHDSRLRGAVIPLRWQYASFQHVFTLAPPVVEWLGYANLDSSVMTSLNVLVFQGDELECDVVISLS